jgi:hypothetical protein
MAYVSKYIAKPDSKHSNTFFIHAPYQQKGRHYRKGRFWGYVNKKALPFDDVVEGLLTDEKAIRRVSNASWEIIGTDNRYGSLSFHLFYDNAKAVAMRNIEAFGRYLSEWEYTIKDHRKRPPQYSRAEDSFSTTELETDSRLHFKALVKGRRRSLAQPLTKDWCKPQYRLDRSSGELVLRCDLV